MFWAFGGIYRPGSPIQSDSDAANSSHARSRTISLKPTFDNKRQLTQIKVDKPLPVHDQVSYLALDCDSLYDTAPFPLPPPLRAFQVFVIISSPNDG